MKCFFSKLWGRSQKSSGNSVLIKDYPHDSSNGNNSAVVPLHGAAEGTPLPLARKKEPVERFTESVDRLVEKLEGINDNLGRQTQQNERLAVKLDELPTLLAAVPEAVNQQRQALLQMVDQLRRKLEQDEAVAQSLTKLPELAGRQSESLEAIEDRLSTAADIDTKMAGTFERMSDSLGKLDAGAAAQVEWLQQISRSFSDNERLIKETLAAQQRRFFRVFTISVVIALVSITGLAIALFVVLR